VSKLFTVGAIVMLSAFVQAQSAQYAKGDVVRVKVQDSGEPTPDCRIIAVAGDRIRVNKSGVFVNDQIVRDVSQTMLNVLTATSWPQVIPAGHYVVIGERKGANHTLAYHGLIRSTQILSRVSD
jgi:signal peptidase I